LNDDDFAWNYGVAKAATGEYKEAEESFLQIRNEKYRAEYTYLAWLSRCFIMLNKPGLAWEQYLKMDTSDDSFRCGASLPSTFYRRN
jgi:intraflagellar transport protein 56